MSDAAEAYKRLRELKFIPAYACDVIAQLFFTESTLPVPVTDDPVPEDQDAPSPDTDDSAERGNYCILDLDISRFHCFDIEDSAFADTLIAPSLRSTACSSYPAASSSFAHTSNDGSLAIPAMVPPSLQFKLPSLLPFTSCLSTIAQALNKALPVHRTSTGNRKRKMASETSVDHRMAMAMCGHVKPEEPHEGAAVRDNAGVSATHTNDFMTNEELSEFIVVEQAFASIDSNAAPGTSVQPSASVAPKLELPTDDRNCYILRGRNVRRYVPDMPKQRRPKDRRAKGFWGVCSTMGFNARNRNCSGRVTVLTKGTLQGEQLDYECSRCGHSRLRYRL